MKLVRVVVLLASAPVAPLWASSLAQSALPVDTAFQESQVVALVQISGVESDTFKVGYVAQATVARGFKGVKDGGTVYFEVQGEFGLRTQYLVFLSRTGRILKDVSSSSGKPASRFPDQAELLTPLRVFCATPAVFRNLVYRSGPIVYFSAGCFAPPAELKPGSLEMGDGSKVTWVPLKTVDAYITGLAKATR